MGEEGARFFLKNCVTNKNRMVASEKERERETRGREDKKKRNLARLSYLPGKNVNLVSLYLGKGAQ